MPPSSETPGPEAVVARSGEADRGARPKVAYLFTRFPWPTETFLQREIEGLVALGFRPDLYSFHGGGGVFCGLPVRRVSKWRLLQLLWLGPVAALRDPDFVLPLARRLFVEWPRDWMNHWENLYGGGIAVVLAGAFRRAGYTHLHGVWASFPAMAAWVLARFTGASFSFGAHAYDLFEYGGDWLLREKAAGAAFIHTSTCAGERRLRALGVPKEKIQLARRGLARWHEAVDRGAVGDPLRIICVARLVPKKGLVRQVRLYAALKRRGFRLSVKIVGDGPLRPELEREIRTVGVEREVRLLGALPQPAVWAELARADVLVHTGEVTRSGDRDGLPNVVPEAMAAGALVITTPAEGVCEAIADGETGFVRRIDDPDAWAECLTAITHDRALCRRVRRAARAWVEANFDARKNAALLLERFRQAAATPPANGFEAMGQPGSGENDDVVL
ncbi:MAG: colanic acid biosynthesis glycosyltransferase WcaL [Verrucomicrobia bacterium]|nr:MAG: colanic acid biosynthesis glycosyltransferase WcaL [Verrucomicrobiota bacterium]